MIAVICMAVGSSIVGCATRSHITLDDFVLMQEELAAAQVSAAGEQAHRVPIDNYLRPYYIGPGDVLEVTLTGLDAPTTSSVFKVRVNKQGKVDLPLAGVVSVGGKEESDAEVGIQAAYVPAVVRELSVNLTVLSYELTNVIVTGAAQIPGFVALRRNERNLLYAVLGAGGVSNAASGMVTLSRVRRPGERLAFDLADPVQLAASLEVDPLENGDIVTVEAAMPNTVFVGGLVNRPGPLPLPPGVRYNMLQVLASVGGLRTDVTPRLGTLLRRMPDGSDVRVKLDLGRIKSGDDPNIMLAAGDILWVPDTLETIVQDFLNKNLYVRAGFTLNYNMTGSDYLNSAARQSALRSSGGGLQDSFDPFGFLSRNAALQSLTNAPPPVQP